MTEYAYPTEQQLDERLKKVEQQLKMLQARSDSISSAASGDLNRMDSRLKSIEERLDAIEGALREK